VLATSHVIVTAFPKVAQLYLDGAAVANPYVADQVRDSAPHRLRVEAPGYQPTTRMLAFDDDIDLEITLEGARGASAARLAAQQTSPPPNCQPPYIVDLETGKMHWRLECF
jgi:hypothetical protein